MRITDVDGHGITAFATNTSRGQLADLELRHRRRARCEDRIRNSKDTGLRNLPLHDFAQNQIWCAIVTLAVELTAWMQLLALTGDLAGHHARRWEPKRLRLRLRLFSIAGRLVEHARERRLHLSTHAPWTELLAKMITNLQWLPNQAEQRANTTTINTEPARGTGDTRATSGEMSHPQTRIHDQRRHPVAIMINNQVVKDPG